MNTIRIGKLRTNTEELSHLAKAWLAISVAFAIVLSSDLFSTEFTEMLLVSAVTVGLGFLLHELAHKLVAQHYHYSAEFRANNVMLLLAILTSFIGFIFAAPGAVMIKSYYIDKIKNGKISLAGPLTNIILAFLFLLTMPFLGLIATYGLLINSWLAIFNMIPIWNLDGRKVLNWSKPIYTITLLVAISLFVMYYLI